MRKQRISFRGPEKTPPFNTFSNRSLSHLRPFHYHQSIIKTSQSPLSPNLSILPFETIYSEQLPVVCVTVTGLQTAIPTQRLSSRLFNKSTLILGSRSIVIKSRFIFELLASVTVTGLQVAIPTQRSSRTLLSVLTSMLGARSRVMRSRLRDWGGMLGRYLRWRE